ncbi:MAG: BrnT family toxin [Pseudomonadota bacterium]
MLDYSRIEGFQWDTGDARKNEDKHGVSQGETEQVFFNYPVVFDGAKHSGREPRSHALGKTADGRLFHITFTLRDVGTKIRIISARPMNRKERAYYDKEA